MQTIRIKHPGAPYELPPLSLALGFFDGVHRGHHSVIEEAKEKADKHGYCSGVMTFYPHPKEILRKDSGETVQYLTPLPEKETEIEKIGVDYLLVVQFDPYFAELSPQQFVDRYLIGINVRHVIAGFDYTYGRLGKGTMETLPFHSRGRFTQTTVAEQTLNGEKISSTMIRNKLKHGEVSQAAEYLGRYFKLSGIVQSGDQRGHTIGFPTANVAPSPKVLIPAVGVYAVQFHHNGADYRGVCNIGYKPTFNKEKSENPVIEVHIFDYSGDLYGEEAAVTFVERIRGEVKFESVEELIEQMNHDSREARNILAERNFA